MTPLYASDGRILFTSDRPRNGDRRLYPQLDEYETAPTVSGLWSMQPDGSDSEDPRPRTVRRLLAVRRLVRPRRVLALGPSAARSAGRRRHLRDPRRRPVAATARAPSTSESSDASHLIAPGDEVFPESRELYGDPAWDDRQPTETDHTFNQFFPWTMQQDGTGLEILNHLGRHELSGYIAPARTYLDYAGVETRLDIFLQIAEDPTQPGTYYGIRCPEFGTRGSGQIAKRRRAAGRERRRHPGHLRHRPGDREPHRRERDARLATHRHVSRSRRAGGRNALGVAQPRGARRSRDGRESAVSAALHAEQPLRLRDPPARAGRAGLPRRRRRA